MIIIGIIILGIALANIGGNKSEQASLDSSKPIGGNEQNTTTESKKPDLELLSAESKNGDYGTRYMVGKVKNNSNKEYSYVQVEINLYKGTTIVGSTLANVNNLGAGETWEFQAVNLEDDADSFKVKDITGF